MVVVMYEKPCNGVFTGNSDGGRAAWIAWPIKKTEGKGSNWKWLQHETLKGEKNKGTDNCCTRPGIANRYYEGKNRKKNLTMPNIDSI